MASQTRRDFLFGITALAICLLPEQRLHAALPMPQDGGGEVCQPDIRILDPDHAKDLLKFKIKPIFDNSELMKDVRNRFHIPWYKPSGVIHVAADIQINNVVDEFKQSNPWDTEKTRNEPITVESLMRRYRARISRLFHEHIGEDYAKFLALPQREQTKQAFDKQFGELEKLLGRSMKRQVGYETVDAQGSVKFNPDWNKVPRWQRPELDFDGIIKNMNVTPSPFLITVGDIRSVGIPINAPSRPERTQINHVSALKF